MPGIQQIKMSCWVIPPHNIVRILITCDVHFQSHGTILWERMYALSCPSGGPWHIPGLLDREYDIYLRWEPLELGFSAQDQWVDSEYGRRRYVPVQVVGLSYVREPGHMMFIIF